MKTDRCARRAQRGAALVLALIAVMVVGVMAMGVVQMSSGAARKQGQAADIKRSFYLAEAGLAESYLGLRTGKTGQVGLREDPALYGDGLFWVDSADEPDGSIRLESTGMCGRGKVKLGMVVRRDEESLAALGFFTDAGLTLQPGSLVDGYASSEGAYEDQAKDSKGPWGRYADGGGRLGSNGDIILLGEDPESEAFEVVYGSDVGATKGKDKSDKLDKIRKKRAEKDRPEDEDDKTYSDSDGVVDRGKQRQEDGLVKAKKSSDELDKEDVKLGDKDVLKEGGTAVFGEVALQDDHRLEVHPGAYVKGELANMEDGRELPPVELPDVEMLPAVDHGEAGPLVVSAGAYEGLRVRKGARAILEGPSTLVLGRVEVDSGGELVFDTSDGSVVVYVTGPLAFAEGSLLSYPDARPDRVEIQIAVTEEDGDEPSVRIETEDALYGMLYAPEATVALGPGVEVFGALVARRMDLGRDVLLHYDTSLLDNDESASMPKLRGWEIVELGTLEGGGARDPFRHLGVDRSTLRMPADAHLDLWIELEYLDALGIEFEFEGWESTFDWSNVEEVLEMKSRKGPDEPVIETIRGKDGWLELKLK